MTERRDQFEYEDLLACARGELFGPGNAQLPLPPMLMFDRISEVKEEGRARPWPHRRRARREARPLVLPLPFQRRSGHARLPWPRRAVAVARLLPWLAGRSGTGPCS